MKMRGDYIHLLELFPQQKSKGGIMLVTQIAGRDEGTGDTPRFGKVLEFGDGAWDLSGCQWINPASRVAVGDVALLSKTGDYAYSWNGEKKLITRTANIIAVLTREECDALGF